jgi:hypothetical protein
MSKYTVARRETERHGECWTSHVVLNESGNVVGQAGSEAGAQWVAAALSRYDQWVLDRVEEFIRAANDDEPMSSAWNKMVSKYELTDDEKSMIWEEVKGRHMR